MNRTAVVVELESDGRGARAAATAAAARASTGQMCKPRARVLECLHQAELFCSRSSLPVSIR